MNLRYTRDIFLEKTEPTISLQAHSKAEWQSLAMQKASDLVQAG